MEKEDPNDVIVKLQSAATDSDASIIEQAAIDAGYYWRCLAPGKRGMPLCNYVNVVGDETCGDCGAACPPALVPKTQVIHILWYGVTLCGKSLEMSKWVRREEADQANCEVCICRLEGYQKAVQP